jgi:hypothetical protein
MDALRRKRARLACKPCRERKRKCDGHDPCITCTEWGYECHYELQHRKSRVVRQATPKSPSNVLTTNATESDHGGLVGRLEANSGAAFVRRLGLRIDASKAPKLGLFGWNIGPRQVSSSLISTAALDIVEITSLEHMKSLAQVYFDKVDPCYGFIDQDHFFECLNSRWRATLKSDLYDSVLAGVAAMGCLFSQRGATLTELHLVHSARECLDSHQLSGPPSIDLVTGWTLRSVYLRMTDSPHSTWMATSTLMHLIEASGLHPDSTSVLLPSSRCDPELGKRLVGVAHHMNAWTSFDLGLSRVSFQKNDLPPLPSPRPGDCTAELLGLLPVSVSLDPAKPTEDTDLLTVLPKVLGRTHTQAPSVLGHCNLVLCIIRRMHAHNLSLSSALAEQVLTLFQRGLDCARTLAMDCSPWHHVSNVPFHVICVLLVMDTRSSLAMLPQAMQTLGLVASTYDTETMREAYSAACLLVLLHQQRRKADIEIFSEALNMQQQERHISPQPNAFPGTEDYGWLGALVTDLPGLERVDLDQFLSADMTSSFSLFGASE